MQYLHPQSTGGNQFQGLTLKKNRTTDKANTEEKTMKIRIKDNQIRFRIQENELAQLLKGESLENHLPFPTQTLTFVLQIGNQAQSEAHFIDQKYIIVLAQNTREIWMETPTDRIAFSSDQSSTNALKIEVELDLMRDK
jgi:hypothetical protein